MAEAIREVVSMAILAELNDPRVQDVTVTYVEVSGDLRRAKVHVSVMGDETKQQLSLHGLQSAAGFLQSRCAARIDMRYTPRIQFLLDQGVKKSIEISRILDSVLPREAEQEGGGRAAEAGAEEQAEPEQGEPATLESTHPPPDEVDSASEEPEPAS